MQAMVPVTASANDVDCDESKPAKLCKYDESKRHPVDLDLHLVLGKMPQKMYHLISIKQTLTEWRDAVASLKYEHDCNSMPTGICWRIVKFLCVLPLLFCVSLPTTSKLREGRCGVSSFRFLVLKRATSTHC
ncbi:uncharacterized protein LOC143470582 isoform X1 [Clavelina lepadiformis]|uniref:uncharacterized protein LOC143468838 n=1 Tax=Clavelina lepadiformis TaxID=159417 RepID=UPI0040420FB8